MDLDAYVAERRGEWNRLEALTRRRKLRPDEADELVLLYQRAATHLSVVRSRSPDPVLVAGLSRLVLAARATITGTRKFSWTPVARFFTTTLPGELYRTRWWWITVGVLFMVAATAMVQYVAGHPEVAGVFMSDTEMNDLVSKDFVSYYSEYQAQNFAARVWTNNAWLTAQCLASGVLIVPVFYLLVQNLLNLGVIGGVMVGSGAGDTFLTYLAPHGFLELTCVFVGAGVGLRIGWAWIAPGPHRTRAQALGERARSGMLVALGLALALFVSGLLEAYLTPSPLPAAVRIAIGVLVWLGFLAYALLLGHFAHHRQGSADLDEDLGEAAVPTR
ncbi:stage II sporulation protein M [Actinoplanes sp. NPDC049265]|uniref:stage II sporulation protein M n=1 Tax=Actinoplanes sp. NPDC049265 TaxID=3363902 RepID=UPI0037131E6C